MHSLLAISAAIIPTAIYALALWWLDRYEKEPLQLLAIAFFWGAIPAILLAILFEVILAVPLEDSPIGPDLVTWGIAPVVEEVLKSLALLGLFRWARNEFDGPLDGIVYGALVGFGFSMTENALYFLTQDASQLNAMIFLRGVVFGMNHALFTSLVGLSLGLVRYQVSSGIKLMAFLGALLLAILLHALHNLLVTYFALGGALFSWLVQSTGILVMLVVAVLAWQHEHRWLLTELDDEVRAGVVTPAEYLTVLSSRKRLAAQWRALVTEGWVGFWQIRHFHYLLTELAFCKSKIQRDDRYQSTQQIEALRQSIVVLRSTMAHESLTMEES